MILSPSQYIEWMRFMAAMMIAACDLTDWYLINQQMTEP